jgi:hypothetical protein
MQQHGLHGQPGEQAGAKASLPQSAEPRLLAVIAVTNEPATVGR